MSAKDTPAYDPDTAAAALWLLRDAHDRWLAEYVEVVATKGDTEHHRTIALRLHQHTASVLTWSRGLDDLCGREPGPLPSYQAARQAQPVLLDGARYACNRSLHQLLTLTRSVGGFSWPIVFPLVADEVGIIRWAEEDLLPPFASERTDQQRIRSAYLARFAGQPVGPALAELREWFEQQLGEAA